MSKTCLLQHILFMYIDRWRKTNSAELTRYSQKGGAGDDTRKTHNPNRQQTGRIGKYPLRQWNSRLVQKDQRAVPCCPCCYVRKQQLSNGSIYEIPQKPPRGLTIGPCNRSIRTPVYRGSDPWYTGVLFFYICKYDKILGRIDPGGPP
jgi:hypothetical protein